MAVLEEHPRDGQRYRTTNMIVLTTLCLIKNDTDVAHYNLDADQPILIFLAEILLREYAIKR